MVAVFLLIALVAAVLVGGRLIQDWNGVRKPVPAAQAHASLASLEARPLQLPQVAPNAVCPTGPQSSPGVYGNGPFYGDSTIAQGPIRSQWGMYFDLKPETDRNISGLLLVRAVDVKTGQHFVFAGQYAVGPVVGTDTVEGLTVQQHPEVVLDTSHRPSGTLDSRTLWPAFRLGVPKGDSGCYGWQIDGDDFTETFIFDAGITS